MITDGDTTECSEPREFNGHTLPARAVALIEQAARSNWHSDWRWDTDTSGAPQVTVRVASREHGERFRYTWRASTAGRMRLAEQLRSSSFGWAWSTAPSVRTAMHRIGR